ncbi:MAG: nuclear transport factor 2 family protein [Pseudomonadota bacterium]
MDNDEVQIRQLVSTWMDATKSGDVDTVLGLMTDDVVFLLPGRPPMRKAEFAAVSRPPAGGQAPIEGHSEIQEITVSGDWAFMWTRLRVTATPPGGAAPMERAGHTLTVLKKEHGKWLLARDANLLTPVTGSTAADKQP